jgi:uncharacterized protein
MAASDPAHDVMHMERVVANARHLASSEAARLEIVVPAAWLHDWVTLPKDSPQRAQALRLAAAEATRLLTNWGCLPDWLPAIAHAIEACSFFVRIEPRTCMLMLGGFTPTPLYKSDDPFCESGWVEEGWGPTFVFRAAEPEEG